MAQDLHQQVVAITNLTFEIVGASKRRMFVFEMVGPSGMYVPCTTFKFGTQTMGGNKVAPESGGNFRWD